MKIGLKLFPQEEEYLKKIVEFVDFIEIMSVVGKDCTSLKEYSIPFVIHNEHFNWHINIANKKREDTNRNSLNFSLKLADLLNARCVIIHPGLKENESCTIQNSVDFLDKFDDERIIIENMPSKNKWNIPPFGQTADDMKEILAKSMKGFCLDFDHSSAAACYFKEDHVEFSREFMKLNPFHFHLSDSFIDSTTDMHLSLGDGNLDIKAFKKMLPKDAWVTLETPLILEKQKNDVKLLRNL